MKKERKKEKSVGGEGWGVGGREVDDEVMLNVLRCQLTYLGQAVTNAEARFNNSLRPRKPEGSLGRTAQHGHLHSHTAPELYGREVGGWRSKRCDE